MINSSTIRNCTVPFPAIEGLVNEHSLGKIRIKNVYQPWKGESIKQIKENHKDNPYTLRIGTPVIDNQLKQDSIFFILHYLSYNPVTKDIEKRDLTTYRNMEKVFIGQSLDERSYSDYRLFVDGNVVLDDIYLKKYQAIDNIPLGKIIVNLMDKVDKLQLELAELKREVKQSNIYTQGTLQNE